MNPDCRDAKHAACSGTGWDEATDAPCACPCACHAPAVTFTHTTLTAGRVTSVCDTCGDHLTSWHGPRVAEFERTHVCERRVA